MNIQIVILIYACKCPYLELYPNLLFKNKPKNFFSSFTFFFKKSIVQTLHDSYYFLPKIIVQQILDVLRSLVVFLKKAIKIIVWISEEWCGQNLYTMNIGPYEYGMQLSIQKSK